MGGRTAKSTFSTWSLWLEVYPERLPWQAVEGLETDGWGGCPKGAFRWRPGGGEKGDLRAPERSVLPAREHRSAGNRASQPRMGVIWKPPPNATGVYRRRVGPSTSPPFSLGVPGHWRRAPVAASYTRRLGDPPIDARYMNARLTDLIRAGLRLSACD